MATIDYEKKYKEAMEKARQFSEKPYLEDSAGIVEYIFPELKESEDEKIRKGLIAIITDFESLYLQENYALSKEDAIAWLEKQEIKEHDVCDTCDEKASCVNPCPVKLIEEEKPTDKVKPKFKVGDKIKLAIEPKYPAREIIAIQNDAYYFDEAVSLPFSRQDEWELVGQKWSEGDEAVLNALIRMFEGEHIYVSPHLAIKCLKSLRPQSQWKPSDEQMEAVRIAAEIGTANNSWAMGILKDMYQDLKKLKG